MWHLYFESCPANPNVWMRPALKDNGKEYYEYVLLYTDDALSIGMNAENVLRKEIGCYFDLKEESVGSPTIYLGCNVHQVELDTGVRCWAFSSSQYVKADVQNVASYLKERHKKGDTKFVLLSKATTPIQTMYRPELGTSPELA